MGAGFYKNFKNRMMDFANISSFVHGHPLKCIKSWYKQALVVNFLSWITAETELNYMATELDFGRNLWHESPKKSRKAPKMAILTNKSKNFIKAKLTASKSCLLGPVHIMIWCIFGDAYLQKMKYWQSPSYDFWNFS